MYGKLGIHSLVYTDQWTEERARSACESAAQIGYELIEVLIFDPAILDVAMTGRVIRAAGLEPRLGMALGPGADISSRDPATAGAGEATVARCLEIAAEIGAPAISGITYAAFNAYTAPPSAAQRDQVVDALGRLDRRAQELGVRLGIEPCNRYETYMVNTLDEAGAMIRAVGSANMFIHMDTFHMHIEEGDIAGAVLRNAPQLGYVHLAESHRGRLGTGSFDVKAFCRALARAGYGGDITLETFSPSLVGPDLVGGVRLWRTQWSDAEEIARTGIELMRSELTAAYATAAGHEQP